MTDYVDGAIQDWAAERPDLDFTDWGLVIRLARVSYYLDQARDECAQELGLNSGCIDVILHLRRAGPPYRRSPTDLFRSLLTSPGAATGRIDKLEQAGFVRRIPSPTDRRALLVELTPAGEAATDRVLDSLLPTRRRELECLSEAEKTRMTALLRKLASAFEAALDGRSAADGELEVADERFLERGRGR